jgi:hypothetical protein
MHGEAVSTRTSGPKERDTPPSGRTSVRQLLSLGTDRARLTSIVSVDSFGHTVAPFARRTCNRPPKRKRGPFGYPRSNARARDLHYALNAGAPARATHAQRKHISWRDSFVARLERHQGRGFAYRPRQQPARPSQSTDSSASIVSTPTGVGVCIGPFMHNAHHVSVRRPLMRRKRRRQSIPRR